MTDDTVIASILRRIDAIERRLRRIDPDNDEMTGDQICDEFRKVLEEAI